MNEILYMMYRRAREARAAGLAAEQAGLAAVAEVHQQRWNRITNACHAFADREGLKIQLSDAIDMDLATLGCNECPEGWRVVELDSLIAYASPECPEILGEFLESQTTQGNRK